MALQLTSGFGAKAGRQIRGLFKEAKALYGPKGGFMKGIEAQLERGQKKAVATGTQSLAAAGLAGTSMMGGLGLQYEEDIATPARAQAETQRLSALSSLLAQEAGAELQMAPRYSFQAPQPRMGGGGGGAIPPGFGRTTSARRPAAATQPSRTMPTLSAFPSLTGAGTSRSIGRGRVGSVQPRLVSRTDPMNIGRAPGTFEYYKGI